MRLLYEKILEEDEFVIIDNLDCKRIAVNLSADKADVDYRIHPRLNGVIIAPNFGVTVIGGIQLVMIFEMIEGGYYYTFGNSSKGIISFDQQISIRDFSDEKIKELRIENINPTIPLKAGTHIKVWGC